MKIIAFYLPQFHRVLENDHWWGKGYTEWIAVKNAEKFYDAHYQPHIPLNQNYYNLLNKETMKWQSELMKKYNIYGMCFYHYYFQNGKKILEKPAENLLEWKEIDMPFCFSWANESWARTWSKLTEKNSWNVLKENNDCKEGDGILLRQDYGEEEEWCAHFNYLLPFFNDNRYIKVDNKPIFIIHKPDLIVCFPKMKEIWNRLAKENGFKGIYFIASNSNRIGYDFYIQQEPNYSYGGRREFVFSYDKLCEKVIRNALQVDNNYFLCGFTGYDDTPRHGKYGKIVEGSNPDIFYKLMRNLFYIGESRGNAFTFVNAWNEWGEGMYLEPDERYGYGYLEALKKALEDYKNINEEGKKYLKKVNSVVYKDNDETNLIKKDKYYVRLFNKWLVLKECKKNLVTYFVDKEYTNIAIYGLGITGKHLITELNNSVIKIMYGIDRSGNCLKESFPIYTLEDILPNVDAIIVSVTYDFDNIFELLKDKFNGVIISLEEIIDYVEKKE